MTSTVAVQAGTVADDQAATPAGGPDPAAVAASPAGHGLAVVRAGTVEYQQAWEDQRRLHEAVVDGRTPDTVLLLEHPSVYTAGKRTEPLDRPMDGTPVVDVDRGGKITWHGPGQLVGYPVMTLPDPVDVVAYVRRVEQLLITVCAELGLATTRIEGRSGAWVTADHRGPDRKIGAIGIRVARGVTLHGFALNCDCDLAAYDRIVPCGIRDAGVTSLAAELGRDVTVAEVLPIVERNLELLLGQA
jgi:lipoyl(octanoyl) transferase